MKAARLNLSLQANRDAVRLIQKHESASFHRVTASSFLPLLLKRVGGQLKRRFSDQKQLNGMKKLLTCAD